MVVLSNVTRLTRLETRPVLAICCRSSSAATLLAFSKATGSPFVRGSAVDSQSFRHSTSGLELLQRDMKIFEIGGAKVAISQIEIFDSSYIAPRFAELRKGMDSVVSTINLDAMLLAVTDIDRSGSQIFVAGKLSGKLAQAFGVPDTPAGGWTPGVMSRKKQLVPTLENALQPSAN
jgi:inorganic pyrophosphatase/exopolyphosphatase